MIHGGHTQGPGFQEAGALAAGVVLLPLGLALGVEALPGTNLHLAWQTYPPLSLFTEGGVGYLLALEGAALCCDALWRLRPPLLRNVIWATGAAIFGLITLYALIGVLFAPERPVSTCCFALGTLVFYGAAWLRGGNLRAP